MPKFNSNTPRPMAHSSAVFAQAAGRLAARPGSLLLCATALVCALTLSAQQHSFVGEQVQLRTGPSLPSSCSQGQVFFLTTAQAGYNLYSCTSANSWAAPAAGGGSLPNSGVTAGSYGSSTLIPSFTVDSQGIVTAASSTPLSVTLPASGVTAGTYGSSTQVPSLTVNSQGIVTGVSLTPVSGGGGGVPYSGATANVDLGSYGLKAAYIDTTGGGPTRLDLLQGACPATANTGMDSTVCLESGVLYQVNSAGLKSMLAPVFGASGPTHTPGLVPDSGLVAGASRFLREDGSWQTPGGSGGGGGGSASPTFAAVPVSSAVASPADVWMLGSGSGNSFPDSSGNANTVTAGGTVTWSAGPGLCNPGPCAHFPGAFDSPAANHTSFNPGSSQPFSVAFWASFDAIGTIEVPISQMGSGAGSPGWYIYKNDGTPGTSTNEMLFVQQDNGGGSLMVAFGSALSAGALHHFVFTADGSHTAQGVGMWMDGNRMSVSTVLHNNLNGNATPNANIYLGGASNGTSRFAGYLAGVHLYNRALTQTEVLPLFFAGPTTDTFTQATRTARTVVASTFATLDADCGTGAKLGGGVATDNTVKLNAVLLTASAANPLDLLLDGCSVTTGLLMSQSGYTAIRGVGWDSGLFVLSGSNASAISNSWGPFPNFAMPARGKNVEIRNLRLNGNRGTFPSGNATIGDARGNPWIMTLDIENIDGVLIDKVWVYDSPSYSIQLGSVGQAMVNNCRIDAPSLAVNTDGIHFNGPANDLHVSHCYIQGGDDLVALNAPEGQGGDITDVEITGIRAAGAGSSSVVRMYTAYNDADGNTHRGTVKNVTLSDVTGTAGIHGLVIFGNGGPQTAADWIQNIFISNVRLASPFWFDMWAENTGDIKVVNSAWIPTAAHPAIYWDAPAGTYASISFSNFSIYRNPDGNQAGWLATIPNGVTINRLELNGVSVVNSVGSSYGAVPYLIDVAAGGNLGMLWMGNADPTNVTTLLSSAGSASIAHIQGPGCAFFTGCTVK